MSFGKVSDSHKEEVNKFGLEIYSWEEFLQKVMYQDVWLTVFINLGLYHDVVFTFLPLEHREEANNLIFQ